MKKRWFSRCFENATREEKEEEEEEEEEEEDREEERKKGTSGRGIFQIATN